MPGPGGGRYNFPGDCQIGPSRGLSHLWKTGLRIQLGLEVTDLEQRHVLSYSLTAAPLFLQTGASNRFRSGSSSLWIYANRVDY